MADITLRELMDATCRSLTPHYGAAEARALALAVLDELLHVSAVDIVLHKDREISELTQTRVNKVTERLLRDEPLQYITGHARFYGNDIIVTPDVLIPRPETEELVDLIVKDAGGRADLRVLDVCTGSGCIAVALGRALKWPVIEAVDISDDALEVARRNADAFRVRMKVVKGDALKELDRICQGDYDIIVSNPPYVMESEAAAMEANVLDYEPKLALFVPDSDPLRFYRAIAAYAAGALKAGGMIYFEINPLKEHELRMMMESLGFRDINVLPDMTGRMRMLRALSPREYD